jgi:dTDP-4-amino-4,6-dideoxygalactose transaminase
MEINSNRLDRLFTLYQQEFEDKALQVLRSGRYVLGNEVSAFEENFSKYVGAKHCVGLASGLDALWIAVRLLGIGAGDEVIVQGNTYIATVMSITANDAKPVFVEPNPFYNIDATKIEEKITDRTKAIIVVHLYGQAAKMDDIMAIAKKHKLYVVEDCAQSHGACYAGRMTGTFGDVGCFSFYPTKNLGAFGDAGAIVTNNADLAEKCKVFRNYGSEKRYHNMMVGVNSRLDELQAALLNVKLSHLDEINSERTRICEKYLRYLKCPHIVIPSVNGKSTSVWHQFVIRSKMRDALMDYLQEKGIGTVIHYPIPPHLSQAYARLGLSEGGGLPITEQYAREVLSLPLYNGMTESEQDYVIDTINDFV